jgi:hypothetical protein
MSEKPLDRLNYFNGQRLEASNLKLEQQYHIRVRRWLNKSLYTTGIARGLEVAQDHANKMNVIVSPGLALDSEGREIILLDQISIGVVGSPSTTPGVVDGNYLTIQYNEQVTEEEQGGCVVHGGKKNGCGCGNGKSSLAWGGPALVRAQAILGWTDALPADTSGKIVLAQVELDSTCNVVSVHPEIRRYVGAASEAQVHQFALEGARDFDAANPQKIYFHIRGRQPNAVTLYLRSEKFSSLYYTELGNHTHGLTVAGTIEPPDPSQVNTGKEIGAAAGDPTPHEHKDFEATYIYNTSSTDQAIFLAPVDHNHATGGTHTDLVGVGVGGVVVTSLGTARYGQSNLIDRVTTTSAQGNPDFPAKITGATQHVHPHSHTHPFKFDQGSSGVGAYGVTDVIADNGRPARTFLDNLQISIDGNNQTPGILTQLQDSRPATEDWSKLGHGGAFPDPLVDPGTGPIRLDLLPLVFDENEHVIELSVRSGGGRILYNLYVE